MDGSQHQVTQPVWTSAPDRSCVRAFRSQRKWLHVTNWPPEQNCFIITAPDHPFPGVAPQQSEWIVQVARGVIGAVVVGHYPLNQHPARLCIEDLEQYFFVKANLPAWTSPVHTLAFVLSTLSVAVVVSHVPVACTQASCLRIQIPDWLRCHIILDHERRNPHSSLARLCITRQGVTFNRTGCQ